MPDRARVRRERGRVTCLLVGALLNQGISVRTIALVLDITPRAVRYARTRLKRKR